MTKCGNQIPNQVMRQRARWLHSLLLEGDRRGFGLAYPDRQGPHSSYLSQQQNWLVLRLLDANADDANFTHLCLPSAPAAISDQTCSDVVMQTPCRRNQAVVRS